MFKKATSLLLALMLIVTSLSVTFISVSAASDETTYVVAGSEALCGVNWAGTPEEAPNNVMSAKDDGTYEKVFTEVAPASALQIKVVENPIDGTPNWIGDETGNNITFNVTTTCDVTVTFDPATQAITVTGDGVEMVTDLKIDSMYAVGNGDGTWLNGAAWNPAAEANQMTEVSKGVYQISFANVEAFENNQVKFAANGTWADSWGGTYVESGVEFDGVYNGDNIIVDTTEYEMSTVTLTLDLTNFNYATKEGAKIKVDVVDESAPETTAAPETTQAATEAPTTEAPKGDDSLTVTATSNMFPSSVAKYDASTNEVTVTYVIKSAKDMLNCQWEFDFDNSVFSLDTAKNKPSTVLPCCKSGKVVNLDKANTEGRVLGNASSLDLYDISSKDTTFVKVVLDVKNPGAFTSTAVDLQMQVMTVSTLNPDTELTDPAQEVKFAKGSVVFTDAIEAVGVTMSSSLTPSTYVGPTEAPTTVAPTTAAPTEAPTTVAPTTAAPTEASTTVAPTTAAPTEAPTTVAPTTAPTEAPTTVAPTTAAPTEAPTTVAPTTAVATEAPTTVASTDYLTVNATSNFFPAVSQVYDASTNEVTVTYNLKALKNMLNCQWELDFDTNVFSIDTAKNKPSKVLPCCPSGKVVNLDKANTEGRILGNASSLELYDISSKSLEESPFVTVVFDVKDLSAVAPVTTEVNLVVQVMTLSDLNDQELSDPDKTYKLAKGGVVFDDVIAEMGVERQTTLSPAAVVPTTVAPTTVAPTTVAPVVDPIYVVAGTDTLCNGLNWNGSPEEAAVNVMTKTDSVFVKTFTDVQPANALSIKVVENLADGTQNWIGDATGNNVTFNVTTACDVTVTYNPATGEITVTGDGVEFISDIEIDSITAVGNGDGTWLNGANWNQADATNHMTEVSDKVYQITYTDIEAYENYQVKFAANDAWTHSWGGTYVESGVPFAGVYNGDNIIVNTEEVPMSAVTLTLDLTNFNYSTKEGAVITITVVATEVPTTTQETTVAPTTVEETTVAPTTAEPTTVAPTTTEVTEATTVAPTTVAPTTAEVTTVAPTTAEVTTAAPTTVAPSTDYLTVNATSNFFPAVSQVYNADTKEVTVTYNLKALKNMLNCQWELDFDTNVFSVDTAKNKPSTVLPCCPSGKIVNLAKANTEGRILGNASSLELYDITSNELENSPFVSVVFDVKDISSFAPTTTTVNLVVQVMTLSDLNDQGLSDPDATYKLAKGGVIFDDVIAAMGVEKQTTLSPAAVVPTTVAPTTEAPTETTVPAADPIYVVAGTDTLCNGLNWNGSPVDAAVNVMTKTDGVFVKTFTDVQPATALSLKVVENLADGTQNWIGDATGNNVTFNVTTACDVTVTYNPVTGEITVTGDGVEFVTSLEVNSITAVGNGDGTWLNGANWNQADATNHMTEVSDKVYQITYTDIEAYENYQVKFAANDAWTDSWGGTYVESGVPFAGVYNGDNIIINTEDIPMSAITLTLDLTNFNYSTKEGAVITVTVVATEVPTTTQETTVAPTTTEATTAPATTEATTAPVTTEATTAPATTEATTAPVTTEATTAPATTEATTAPATTEATVAPTTVLDNSLTVNATSNFFPATSKVVKTGDKVTVTYYFDSAKELLNAQWTLTYDSKLAYSDADNKYDGKFAFMPQVTTGGMYNTTVNGTIKGNCSDLGLYDFSSTKPFVQVTFDAVEAGEANVNLVVDVMTLSKVNPETGLDDETQEEIVVKNGVMQPTETAMNVSTEVKVGTGVVPTEPATTAPVTTEATTAPVTTEATTAPVTEATTVPVTTAPVTEATTAPVTTAPVTEATTAPVTTAPVTEATTAPVTTAPVTEATTAPVTTAPVTEATTAPATTAPVTEATTAPATTAPVTEATTAPATTQPTTAPATTTPETTTTVETTAPVASTGVTSATGATVNGSSTADTANNGTSGSGAVQTGNASMAIIILLVLVSATGAVYFTRKRIK